MSFRNIFTEGKYLEKFQIKKERKSKITTRHQSIGLEIASILNDKKKIPFYIKLVKMGNADFLLSLAKNTAEKKDITNKSAYFLGTLKKKITEYHEKKSILDKLKKDSLEKIQKTPPFRYKSD